jgi:hypothetical protein
MYMILSETKIPSVLGGPAKGGGAETYERIRGTRSVKTAIGIVGRMKEHVDRSAICLLAYFLDQMLVI